MLDPVRHPDIDETVTWRSWGEVMEHNPRMLGGILSLLPEAETVEEGNRRILALYLWLLRAEHRNVVVARPARTEHEATQEPGGTEGHGLENHAIFAGTQAAAEDTIAPLALRITGQNRHIDPPSHLSLPPSWQVVSVGSVDHREAYQWPHVPADEILSLVDPGQLAGWLDAIHHCEVQWLSRHPETVVARLTAVGELVEEENGNLSLPSATWEGIGRVIRLPLHERSSYQGNIEWLNRMLHKEGPDEEARRLREALAPAEILRDQRFSKAAIQISYHPPSEGRLASIERDRLAARTGLADGNGAPWRL